MRQTGAQAVRSAQGPNRAVTRADVARLAGVSSAVVSYVVNDGPRPVAAATADRVREAMELLGYRPNASARALRTGTTETVGLVLGDSRNPFFTEYTFELVKAAAGRGKQLLIGDAQHGRFDEAEIVDTLIARQVDGVLLATSRSHSDVRIAARTGDVPTVMVNYPAPLVGRRTVGSGARTGARDAVAHLIGHGRRRVALVMGTEGFGDPDPRESGWLGAHLEADLSPGPVVRVPFTRAGGYAATVRLLDSVPEVDAIFASNDLQAIGVLRALHERGRAIPDDISVASFDGTVESAFSWPPLTVARQNLPAMAAACFDLLAADDVPRAGRHVEIPTDLIRRMSCGCPTPPEFDLREESDACPTPSIQ